MQNFVLDCSATMAYFFKDETSTYVDSAFEMFSLNGHAFVPPNWSQEVVNTCMSAIRRKRISMQEVMSIYRILKSLPITITPNDDSNLLEEIHQIADRFELTAYDAAYLYLAIKKNLPLVTLDKHLKRMAKKAGVSLWEPVQY